MLAGLAAASLLLLQSAGMQAAPAPPSSVGHLLADKLDVAFRACALQITERGRYLTPANKEALDTQGILLASPPSEVLMMGQRLFGDAGIYASVTVPKGNIWIAGSATAAACKVTFGDTDLALNGRYDWTTRLRRSSKWTYDRARSGQDSQIMRDFFVLNADRPGPHLVLFVDGPNTVVNDGKGIQSIMTITLEAAEVQ